VSTERTDLRVFVALLDEGTDVWRSAEAEAISSDLYRLLGTVPEGEVWEFQPGQTVRCSMREFSDGVGLVAIEQVSNGPTSATSDS